MHPAVAHFTIPAQEVYGIEPLDLAADTTGNWGRGAPDGNLVAAVISDDLIAVRNEGCDQTFVIAKAALLELAKELS